MAQEHPTLGRAKRWSLCAVIAPILVLHATTTNTVIVNHTSVSQERVICLTVAVMTHTVMEGHGASMHVVGWLIRSIVWSVELILTAQKDKCVTAQSDQRESV